MSKNYFLNLIWSSKDISSQIVKNIKQKSEKFYSVYKRIPNIMEVCGTHTVAIARSGIRNLLSGYLNLISGPGCPVCVTSQGDIDRILEFAKFRDVIIATFGDMVKVKGSKGYDLSFLRMEGVDVRVVYSAMDAVDIAAKNPNRDVVFIGVGFETTAPTVAASLRYAKQKNINNFL